MLHLPNISQYSIPCCVLFKEGTKTFSKYEPVWPTGKAGKQKDLGLNPLRLSFLFKRCGLWTLSCDFVPHDYLNIKMALIAAHLNAGVILVVTVT